MHFIQLVNQISLLSSNFMQICDLGVQHSFNVFGNFVVKHAFLAVNLKPSADTFGF